ncbi:hypothetical protein EVAR_90743_1 [Eumeta japonica]|uniref:Uncharacterized protein n=1 Tax=Eumeta variegata TaxID=151549 RepID=A0A4C1ZBM6_EUMVA|nr:hypothetical protein EVAR_90743_1 [Eumeta japonica]
MEGILLCNNHLPGVKKTVKDYAVVQFIESELYSEIPSNWLLYDSFAVKDKTSCRWPGRKEKNFTQKIKNRVDPSKDWPIRAVNVIRFCVPALPSFPRNSTRHDTHKKNKCQGSDSVESREGLSEADSSDDSVNETLARARALLNDNNFNKDTSGETAAGSQNDDSITENNRNWNTVEISGRCYDLKQRSVSNNGNSRVNSAISEEVDTYLKLNTRDAVIAFEEKLATSTAFENEFTWKSKSGKPTEANVEKWHLRKLMLMLLNEIAHQLGIKFYYLSNVC